MSPDITSEAEDRKGSNKLFITLYGDDISLSRLLFFHYPSAYTLVKYLLIVMVTGAQCYIYIHLCQLDKLCLPFCAVLACMDLVLA